MSEASDDGRSVGVLKELDGQVPTRFYWQLTLLATLGGFLFAKAFQTFGNLFSRLWDGVCTPSEMMRTLRLLNAYCSSSMAPTLWPSLAIQSGI